MDKTNKEEFSKDIVINLTEPKLQSDFPDTPPAEIVNIGIW